LGRPDGESSGDPEEDQMPRFKEIEVALNELAALERKLKNPGGPVENAVARYAVRVAIVSVEAIAELSEREELTVSKS
jgi:hypothetical protein